MLPFNGPPTSLHNMLLLIMRWLGHIHFWSYEHNLMSAPFTCNRTGIFQEVCVRLCPTKLFPWIAKFSVHNMLLLIMRWLDHIHFWSFGRGLKSNTPYILDSYINYSISFESNLLIFLTKVNKSWQKIYLFIADIPCKDTHIRFDD
jgi:hypothetical protein